MLTTPFGISVFLQPLISSLVPVCITALQLFLQSYTLFPSSTTMLLSPEQEENGFPPILIMLLGIIMLTSPLQPEKAALPIVVTL